MRPKDKKELLRLSNENFEKLFCLIDSFDDKVKRGKVIFNNNRDKNIRDILTHLHHWHLMMLEWYKIGMSGKIPSMPAEGYTWRDTKKLNRKIWEMYQDTEYDKAVKLLRNSFLKMKEIMQRHTNKELFEKRKYKWTGTTSLGSYIISATSSHYDWAMKLLKTYKRNNLKQTL